MPPSPPQEYFQPLGKNPTLHTESRQRTKAHKRNLKKLPMENCDSYDQNPINVSIPNYSFLLAMFNYPSKTKLSPWTKLRTWLETKLKTHEQNLLFFCWIDAKEFSNFILNRMLNPTIHRILRKVNFCL